MHFWVRRLGQTTQNRNQRLHARRRQCLCATAVVLMPVRGNYYCDDFDGDDIGNPQLPPDNLMAQNAKLLKGINEKTCRKQTLPTVEDGYCPL